MQEGAILNTLSAGRLFSTNQGWHLAPFNDAADDGAIVTEHLPSRSSAAELRRRRQHMLEATGLRQIVICDDSSAPQG